MLQHSLLRHKSRETLQGLWGRTGFIAHVSAFVCVGKGKAAAFALARIYDFDARNWTKWDVWTQCAFKAKAKKGISPPHLSFTSAQPCLELKQDASHGN
jgi:hypothetical protein